MKLMSIVMIVSLISVVSCVPASADSITILKQGLVGAGSGAVASAMSGAKGDAVWKGALAGAGVTVVGGALLDILTGERVGTVTYVTQTQPQYVLVPAGTRTNRAYRRIYRQGFKDGYRRGYRDGYRDAGYDICGY